MIFEVPPAAAHYLDVRGDEFPDHLCFLAGPVAGLPRESWWLLLRRSVSLFSLPSQWSPRIRSGQWWLCSSTAVGEALGGDGPKSEEKD